MEENKEIKEESVVTKRKKAKIAVISLCAILVLLLGLQVYASVNGYGNVFFMIKNLITTGTLSGEEEIFSDKDITLSYKSIELAEGLKIQANRLEIKDGKSSLYLSIKSQDGEPLPLKYVISTLNHGESKITGNKPKDTDYYSYEDILTLDYEVDEKEVITLKIKDSSDKELRTLEINLETREITITGESNIKKISKIELRKYLDLFTQLNNGANTSDALIYMAKAFEINADELIDNDDLKFAKDNLTDRAFTNAIIKEFYGDKAKFEFVKNPYLGSKGEEGPNVEVLKGILGWEFDEENDSYRALTAGEDYRYGRCLKIEDISYENEVYTVKYIYILLTDNDQFEDNLENLPQYETTIKLKRDDNQIYSKYQVVSIGNGIEVKNRVDTNIDKSESEDDYIWKDEYDVDFFRALSGSDYEKNFTDPQNGQIAIAKIGEEFFKTTVNNGYYTYTDMWNNSYDIKKIQSVDSEFIQTNLDGNVALFRCTIYYTDNNNKEKSFDVAVTLQKDLSSALVVGTYNSYTGSTAFRRFAGLSVEDAKTDGQNSSSTSTDFENYWAPGIKFNYPKKFKLTKIEEDNPGEVSTKITGSATGENAFGDVVETNLLIKIFVPYIVDEQTGYDTLYNPNYGLETHRIGFEQRNGTMWYQTNLQWAQEEGYNYTEQYVSYAQLSDGNYVVYKIQFVMDNSGNFEIGNIIDELLGSIKTTSM